jgi:hypothetical protein
MCKLTVKWHIKMLWLKVEGLWEIPKAFCFNCFDVMVFFNWFMAQKRPSISV